MSDEQVRQLIWGFACGAPKADVSAATEISEKSVVSLILALRSRLTRPSFFIWHAPGDVFLTYDWPHAQQAAEGAVFGVIAMCYFDKRCVSNFRQGRRKQRICRHCTIEALFDDGEVAEMAVGFVDMIHTFYQHLGIGGERNREQTAILIDRWKPTLIIQRAREQSMVIGEAPDFGDSGERSCRALYDKLIQDLETESLTR